MPPKKNVKFENSDDDISDFEESESFHSDLSDNDELSGGESEYEESDIEGDDSETDDNNSIASENEGDEETDEEYQEYSDENPDDDLVSDDKKLKKICHYKGVDEDIVVDDDEGTNYDKNEKIRIPDDERISDPILTYYEMVRIIGVRAQQFKLGAEPLVKGIKGMSPAKMAYIELSLGMTPFIIRRSIPGLKYEEWKCSELKMIHVITDPTFLPDNYQGKIETNQKK